MIDSIYFNLKNNQQECIPVGCVLPAHLVVSATHAHILPRMPPAMHTPHDACPPTTHAPCHAWPPCHSCLPCHACPPLPHTHPAMHAPRCHACPPWTETLTHATQNITLPQTSFAGGKNPMCDLDSQLPDRVALPQCFCQ